VWHFLDPVSNIERQRSDAAYTRQGNRSPFVDRPEWVEAIYGPVFTLTASVSQGNVTFTWPAILPDAMKVLETSVDLVSWIPLSVTPTTQGSVKNATVTQPAGRAFYRLRLQPTAG